MSTTNVFCRFVGDAPYTAKDGSTRHQFVFEDDTAKNPMYNRFKVSVDASTVPSLPANNTPAWYMFRTSIYQNRMYIAEYLRPCD